MRSHIVVVVIALGACGEVKSAPDEPMILPDAVLEAPEPPPAPGPVGLYTGKPSPLIGVHRGMVTHDTPRLSSDGERLYYAVPSEKQPFVAFRNASNSFGDAVALQVDNDWHDYEVATLTLSDDETEIIVQASSSVLATARLYRATRQDRAGAFGALRPIGPASTASTADYHPFLRGNELFFTTHRDGGSILYRATRSAPGQDFGNAVPLTVDGVPITGEKPFLTADGKTLYFGFRVPDDAARIQWAPRTGDTTFGKSTELSALTVADADTSAPFLDEARGEILFESKRLWSPAPRAIWRARLCKGEPCKEDVIDCPDGLRSDDLRHCYVAVATAATWDAARKACKAKGEHTHLATIHSFAERARVEKVVRSKGAVRAWIGASDMDSECTLGACPKPFVWESGEPFLYGRAGQRDAWYNDVQPDNVKKDMNDTVGEDCLELAEPGANSPFKLNDLRCESSNPYVCESEIP